MNMNEYQTSMKYIIQSKMMLEEVYKRFPTLSEHDKNLYHELVIDHGQHNFNFGLGLGFSKVFEINDDIIRLITLTDNEYTLEHKLPFDVIFIEAKIPVIGRYDTDFKTNIYYHGFLVFNIYNDYGTNYTFPWYKQEKKNVCDIRIMGVYSKDNKLVGLTRLSLVKKREDTEETETQLMIPEHEAKQIRSFVLNFLDFLNDPDIEFVVGRHNKRNNEKRIRKGKMPLPESTTIIVKNKLKRYISDLKRDKYKFYSYRFWVRGHWRTFRSEIYGENQGKKIWIKPYIKGDGLMISKNYELRT